MGLFDRMSGALPPPPGRPNRSYAVPERNEVLGTPLDIPRNPSDDVETITLGMGCFWGSEEIMWQIPGVITTSVGYQGGVTENPTYEDVCTGRTGHAEMVKVTYSGGDQTLKRILSAFWENHDPTQKNRQGNDVGSQYRSAIFADDSHVLDVARRSAAAFQEVLSSDGIGEITTEIAPADALPYYLAEGYHQQYLHKVPHGYRCHSSTGLKLPEFGLTA
ncbi:MAG: peptide-methionine (S)-S-oxide reductase MsrA [Actinomycetia bacterium]|nr:peptide-methionine (S)-S-oxide reductase MsrA [Actinomycetes bacterium]